MNYYSLLSFKLILLFTVFFGYNRIEAQTVDSTNEFSPIKTTGIVYAEMSFKDVDTDGNYDCSFVLSEPEISAWGDYSISLAFYDEGLQIRNGGSFTNSKNFIPIPDQVYQLWFDVDVTAKTYSTFLYTEGMQGIDTIFMNAAFRKTDVSGILRWAALHNPDAEPDVVNISKVAVVEKVGITGNYAMSLPGGADGNVSNVALPAFNLTDLPLTIEAWIYPIAKNDYGGVLYYRGNATNGGIQFDKWTNDQTFRGIDNDDVSTIASNNVNFNEWNHVAWVVTSNSMTLYLNKVKTEETSVSPEVMPFDGGNYIGWDAATADRTIQGYFDEVRVWNTARTEQEIEDNKFNTLNGDETGLIAYYNFNDTASVATDLTANAYHGVINGGTYVTSSLISPMKYIQSIASQDDTNVNAPSSDNVAMNLIIETENETNPLILEKLLFSTSGTTSLSDIANVKVFSTGNNETFNDNNKIADLGASPNETDFMFDLNHELVRGKNHLWITYDVSVNAANGNELDVTCNGFTLSGQEHTPANSSPDGKLLINKDIFINHIKLGYDILTTQGFTSDRSANFVSFQQNAITTYKGYQYTSYWNTARHVCIARKQLPDGEWEEIELSDYTTSHNLSDNHYNISFGICEMDGTIHLSFDHHNDNLNYRVSTVDLVNDPKEANWSASSFGPTVNNLENGVDITGNLFYGAVTYPRFITKPNGDLLFECRTGISGDGNSHLWEYSGETQTWEYIGEYLHGRSDGMPGGYSNKCGYINGLHYDPQGRLHVSLVWRETPNPPSNHDVYYAYSDDDGRTWKNTSGVTIGNTGSSTPSQILNYNSPGFKVYSIAENRGLINQESQAVDSKGNIHILQSYMLDSEPNSTDWMGTRSKAWTRHIYQDESGVWQSDLIAPVVVDRSEIAVDEGDNLYVVIPGYKIYFASAADKWQTWTEFDITEYGTTTAEPLIDRESLLNESVLSFVFAHNDKNGKLIVPYYLIDKSKPGNGNGLNIIIYNDDQWANAVIQKLDSVNIKAEDISSDDENLSLKIEGVLETEYAEEYNIHLTTSGNTKMWVNDELVIETGDISSETKFTITLDLQASHKYQVRIEGSYEASSLITKLEWSSERQQRAIVPLSALYGNLVDGISTAIKINSNSENAIRCFPNPFKSTITLQAEGDFNYEIYNATGKLVKSGKGQDSLVTGEELTKGLYFIKIYNQLYQPNFTIVKQ